MTQLGMDKRDFDTRLHTSEIARGRKPANMVRAFAVIVTALVGICASRDSGQTAPPQIFSVVHTFTIQDGSQPYAGLTPLGNALFGTTRAGGTSGDGTVFAVNTDGSQFQLLHSFSGPDGSTIAADLTLAGNVLYGAAYQGGTNGQGTLFSLLDDGSGFTNTYAFVGTTDGGAPRGGLLLAGNTLYGTASAATSRSLDGTVFSIDTNGGNFTVLHRFAGLDGKEPLANLVLGDNMLYGTTYNGGESNLGTIFCLETNGANFTVLHSFSNTDGALPAGALLMSGGTLYGTAASGGAYGIGVVFSINTNGAGFNVLRSFFSTPLAHSTDGAMPAAGLCLSRKVLYGTTFSGGLYGSGTIFSIEPTGSNYTQLFSFGENSADGANPYAPVVAIGNSLYGTTVSGGAGKAGIVYGLKIRGVAFTSQPSGDTNVPVGSAVFFGAGAVSLTAPTAPLQYQWRLNGVNIPGATNETLSFGNVVPTNGGSLTMIVSDGTDATTSLPVGFSVVVKSTASNNDNFANRFLLGEAASGVVKSSNTNASREPGEPKIFPGNPGGKSIWFRWQPDVTGAATFTTRGSDFDTIMGVYTGKATKALTRVSSAINDDDYGGYLTSRVSFDCVAGIEYEIAVDGYWGASGNVVLSWSTITGGEPLPTIFQAPPRQTVVSNGTTITFVCQTSNATPEWYFNARATGVTGTNLVIGVVNDKFVGTYVAQFTNGSIVFSTEPALLETSLLEDGTTDPGSAGWTKFLDSANTPYSNPQPALIRKLGGGGDTRGYSVAQTFSTTGATTEPGEPAIDGQIGGSPVWYTWVTPTNGAMLIDTTGSTFNTMLGVFVGSAGSFATLSTVGAGYTTNRVLNGQPQVYVPEEPKGQTNFIVVDGYHGATGLVHLNISLGSTVVIDTPPQNQLALAGGNATFTVAASGSTPLYYYWQINGTNIADATNSSVTISNVTAASTGLYTVIVSNLVSVTNSSATLSFGTVPAISIQPQSRTVAVGGTATLSVTASGLPSPDYQWMFSGSPIGSDSSAIAITNFGTGNNGCYFVIVSNSFGMTTSSNAQLLLNTLALQGPAVNTDNFQAQLIGAAGGSYILQTSTDLLTWIPLVTNSATNGFIQLNDTNVSKFGYRFYRGVTN